MSSNIEKFREDLNRLLKKGAALDFGITIYAMGPEKSKIEFKKAGYSDDQIKNIFDNSASFRSEYEPWYSECLALIKQLVPDRLNDFISHCEPMKGRKELHFGSYVIRDALLGSRVTRTRTGTVVVDAEAAIPHLQNQVSILRSAKARFDSSIFEIKQIIQADLFDSELSAAREILRNKFLRGAGAISGVVLEKHLAQVCKNHNLTVSKKNPGISDLNELLKNSSAIDIPQWRHITLMGDYRNICDHNKQKEPTHDQVSELIDGTDKIIKTIS